MVNISDGTEFESFINNFKMKGVTYHQLSPINIRRTIPALRGIVLCGASCELSFEVAFPKFLFSFLGPVKNISGQNYPIPLLCYVNIITSDEE